MSAVAASAASHAASDASRRPTSFFLTAHWRRLVMANYRVDPAIVAPLVPRGVELDFHQGQTYVSVVGFLFLQTRLLGVPIPWHRHFEEVNLRFYVRREVEGEVRRGVVFEDYDLPGLRTVDHVCVLGSEKAAWFRDTEGNIMAVVQDEQA